MKIIQKINKISALYLWWYGIVFILVVADLKLGFLSEGLKNILARYPYQWDYELMFTILFFVWGIFLWKDFRLNKFSGYAFLTQGIVMVTLGIIRQNEIIHLFTDSILWIILGCLLLKQSKVQFYEK
ncbi:hypothetical protein IT400_01460 [Candidatus Nomurabacteria bacterium]|nr:hypothetical protein [Candidatus Nomurabacteria bacterium]